ncbi:MopE-related protein [Geothermobacter hydrogeniphilus]|nr:MopE-related protein [Geothermobacter hydrogeniphilus]
MRIFLVGFLFLITATVFAAPNLVNYQGVLTDSSGAPVTNAGQAMTFRLYDAPTAGKLLWEETRAVAVQNGSYSLLLGSVTPFPADLFQSDGLWLEIIVGGEVLGSRQQLASVPYALQAGRLAPGVMSCLPDVFINCYSGPAGTRGVGLCRAGERVCGPDGLFSDCQGEVVPVTETCDGQDNDCDAVTDEGCPCNYNGDPDGVCGSAMVNATTGTCDAPTGYESVESTCDGQDNDCDGMVDEGCSCNYNGDPDGVCGTAVINVTTGICDAPTGYESVESTCDGQDNDCDGMVDEGCPCNYYADPDGVCGTAVINVTTGTCDAPIGYESVESTCDGLDNDCDAVVDEGCSCNYNGDPDGVCGTAVINATTGACNAPIGYESVETTCDGLDNDCDGMVDEGC